MFNDKKVLTNIKTGIIFDLTINIKYLTKGNFQMKETAIRKINKVGHIGFIISKIIRICLWIGLVGAIIGEVALWILPSDLFKVQIGGDATVSVSKQAILTFTPAGKDDEILEQIDSYIMKGSMDIDGNEYAFADISVTDKDIIIDGSAKSPAVITMGSIRGAVGYAIAIIVCALILFKFVSRLCKALASCTTPFEDNVCRTLNRFSIVLLIYVIVKGTLAACISGLLAGANSFSLSVDFSAILLALGIYVLSIIFKYGAILQRESDETL